MEERFSFISPVCFIQRFLFSFPSSYHIYISFLLHFCPLFFFPSSFSFFSLSWK
ncbi:hypothetical protein BCR33DRAFT_586299 [Rhizoclosmatium globosum]|uniref:Uncharacterized protein n=1 Tax=Rhizoclosmatium globosum TaxID=329046 RepID=A0A1Y2CT95_9FUNG|nr:hypothetical protein BCR33DRAFT_586299 [Rhizoclosmatium globosum]|eukprot:ORY49585.1 hypothetical protein BCR33DRAFT_586299 [Rhizoclosmatium globosum]